jgi:hypothetical protein
MVPAKVPIKEPRAQQATAASVVIFNPNLFAIPEAGSAKIMPVRLKADISSPNVEGSSPNALKSERAIGGTLNILTGIAKLARKMTSRMAQAYVGVFDSFVFFDVFVFATVFVDIAIFLPENDG